MCLPCSARYSPHGKRKRGDGEDNVDYNTIEFGGDSTVLLSDFSELQVAVSGDLRAYCEARDARLLIDAKRQLGLAVDSPLPEPPELAALSIKLEYRYRSGSISLLIRESIELSADDNSFVHDLPDAMDKRARQDLNVAIKNVFAAVDGYQWVWVPSRFHWHLRAQAHQTIPSRCAGSNTTGARPWRP